jgi:hypothetical protein
MAGRRDILELCLTADLIMPRYRVTVVYVHVREFFKSPYDIVLAKLIAFNVVQDRVMMEIGWARHYWFRVRSH